MNWQTFPYFAIAAVLCWLAGTLSAFRKRQRGALMLSGLGSAIFLVFIIGFWIGLDRPPLRTMGETRLWYSFFLSVVGMALYGKCRYPWMLGFSTLMSLVFTLINILKPEIHSQTLMPALQSLWFVPHVSVYMFSYSLLGCATLLSVVALVRRSTDMDMAIERLLYAGLAFLSVGMLTGALWAKDAWGAYWSWDPKESWAAATWGLYLTAIHLAPSVMNTSRRWVYHTIILLGFVALQMCWYGVNYLPSAATSVHTYS